MSWRGPDLDWAALSSFESDEVKSNERRGGHGQFGSNGDHLCYRNRSYCQKQRKETEKPGLNSQHCLPICVFPAKQINKMTLGVWPTGKRAEMQRTDIPRTILQQLTCAFFFPEPGNRYWRESSGIITVKTIQQWEGTRSS